MLYRCDCKDFNSNHNNYRQWYIDWVVLYSQYFLDSKLIHKIGIILFEPGGLLDETMIIEKILNHIIYNNYMINIIIYIVEPMQKNNLLIEEAQKIFIEKLNNYIKVNIEFHFFCDVFNLKKTIRDVSFDYLLFLSLDSYEYLFLEYYKNEKNDIAEIAERVLFFLDISLFSIKGFFYNIELSFLIYNKTISNNFFLKKRFFGNNNSIKYMLLSKNLFNS